MEKDFRDYIAPSVDDRVRIRRAVNDYAYYALIFIISVLAMFVPPLCFGCVNGDMGMNFPKTPEAWVIWGVLTGSTSFANMSILVMFKQQAKKNVKNNENYKKACAILNKLAGVREVFVPRSPSKVNASDYIKKGATIMAGTAVSFAAIAPLILSFDVVMLISTVISVSVSVVTSWACMIRNEEYWTEEYLLYAQMMEQRINKRKEEQSNDQN